MEPILYGRDATLATLRTALEGAFAGRGQLAIISGEAGIGKSALAAAVAREAEQRGAAVTWGRAWEFADAPPYFPLWPCLRSLGIAAFDRDGREQQQGQPLTASPTAPHDDWRAFRLWERVVTSLFQAASRSPFVWILEDLHASDLGTLDLLTFLAQPLRSMAGLVVATVRARDPRLSERIGQRLTRLARDGIDIRLEPLSEADVAALVEERLGRVVPLNAAHRVAELTGGNPLFVVECARAFRSAGGVEGTLDSLPPTVRQVVLDRVTPLPDATQRALSCGAVLGREFSAASVARMEGSLPARVIDTLLPTLRAGLLKETTPGQFTFSHALVRDAVEGALGAEERAALHGLAAAALEVLGDTAEVLVERARHALASLRSGESSVALAVAERAARLLESEGAFDRAYDLYARIAEAESQGLLPPSSNSQKLHVAGVARAANRSSASRRLCEAVIASTRASGDPQLFARAVLLLAADVRPAVIDRTQVALLEEARGLQSVGPRLASRLLARLATALQPATDLRIPHALARDARAIATTSEDNDTILDVLDLGIWGLYGAPLTERIEWASELLSRALRSSDRHRALTAYLWLAFERIEANDLEAFERDVASMLALSDDMGHPRYRWRALLIASALATARGHFAESDRNVTEVRELSALIDDPTVGLSLVTHEIMRKRVQRRDDEVRVEISKLPGVMTDVSQAGLVQAYVRAGCAARREDVEATRAELQVIGPRAPIFFRDLAFAALIAEAYALAGTDEERHRARAVIAAFGIEEIPGHAPQFSYDGPLVRILGLLDAALGDLTSAERELREAHARASRHGHPPWVAQIAYELSKLLKRARKDEEARHYLAESQTIARNLGMTGLLGDASTADSANEPAVTMVREGDVFRIANGSAVVRVRDTRGMQLLARLVERPGEEMHVLALVSNEVSTIAEANAGDVLDQRARQAYRERVTTLGDELAAAEANGDATRAATLEREREALRRELARAVGLGGRSRKAASATERARVNVQRRVRDAIARIGEANEVLGRFFDRSVSTGTFCCFRP